jgi:hypothetical protein
VGDRPKDIQAPDGAVENPPAIISFAPSGAELVSSFFPRLSRAFKTLTPGAFSPKVITQPMRKQVTIRSRTEPASRFACFCVVMNLMAGLSLAAAAEENPTMKSEGVQITDLTNKVRVEINGGRFTEYLFQDLPRPCFYPLIGPGNAAMTRHWPLEEAPDESHDHQHHRSLWFAHSSVNGVDCWNEGADGRIVHAGFDEIKSGKDSGVIRTRDNWVSTNGTVLCTDERTFRVYNRPANERLFDFEITLHASHGDVTFGDNKDGGMAVRLAETMRLTPNQFNTNKPGGHIVNSAGVRDGDAWGKRADWVDYHGPVDGKIVGIAIFDNPQNPRHPTWWHVRDYGLFAANPFGKHHFENLKDEHAGDLVLPAGKSITFRYRFYIHEGDELQSDVAGHYQDYVKAK